MRMANEAQIERRCCNAHNLRQWSGKLVGALCCTRFEFPVHSNLSIFNFSLSLSHCTIN